MNTTGNYQAASVPKAIIHKQILDAASARPEATMAELSTAVSGASVELVERVLEEYGDPGRAPAAPAHRGAPGDAVEPSQDAVERNGESAVERNGGAAVERDGEDAVERDDETAVERNGETAVERNGGASVERNGEASVERDGDADLTVAQRELLRLIYEHPTASQRELGARLGVSHTAVYHRVQSIAGLDWADRWAYVVDYFEDGDRDRPPAVEAEVTPGGRGATDAEGARRPGRSLESSPRLVLKVVNACLESDALTDDEVGLVVADLLGRPGTGFESAPAGLR